MNFKTAQFFAARRKKIKQQQSKSNNNINIEDRALHSVIVVPLGIYDGHSPITLLINIFRAAVSSGNRTQIGINSVRNHRIDQRRLFLSIPFVGENNYLYQKKGKLNRSTSCFADVNECATGKHNCNGSSICHNTKGSFRCICREPGYFWNGVNCTGKYLLYIEIVDSSDKKGR